MPVATSRWRPSSVSLSACRLSQGYNLDLDRLRQQRSRAIAQYLGQRIDKSSWLRELENISLGHGVSLLRWRSGGVEHPHDTPPYPFMPSPTFALSSLGVRASLPHTAEAVILEGSYGDAMTQNTTQPAHFDQAIEVAV